MKVLRSAGLALASVVMGMPCLAQVAGQSSRELPAGLTRLLYVQGDGASSYFETDYRPNPQTDRIEVRLAFTSFAADQTIFSAGMASPAWASVYSVGQKKLYCCYAAQIGKWTSACPLELDTPYVFSFENNTVSWPGGDETYAQASPQFEEPGENLKLFAYVNAGVAKGVGSYKLFSVRVWRGGELLHDFVPVRTAEGVATLYDAGVSPAVLTRYGTFAPGPEKPTVLDPGLLISIR